MFQFLMKLGRRQNKDFSCAANLLAVKPLLKIRKDAGFVLF